MSFVVERRFSLLVLEEGEDYIADVAATMSLVRKGKVAESKGRLRIGSKSLVFQPDEVSASILKFPFRYTKSINEAERAVAVECEQFVQVATKTGAETRIVTPFSILKAKMTVSFHVHYASVDEYLGIIRPLWEASSKSSDEAETIVKDVLTQVTAEVQFDMSRLGHRERALLGSHLWVRRVKPLLEVRGMLQISDEAIYFQPHPNFESKPVKRLPQGDVLHVFRRIYGVQANALEIITVHGSCLYLCFEAQGDCDRVAAILREQRRAAGGCKEPMVASLSDAEDILHNIRKMTALWQSGLLSNFHYVDFLNCAAGRSQNDFSQYPVFPWVLKDYSAESLRLGDPEVYRDLSKPIGALNEKRLGYFKERMVGMAADEQFLYGTHYSTPAYVIYWLLRAMPERMLRLHNGHFDTWPRLFRSVVESWESVNESTASLMELIPEFFVLPANWLTNSLGITLNEGPLADVQLPCWAADVRDFVCKMRAALESEWVSQHLPAWIDLIFGHKQTGEEATKADNLFHPVCYTGSNGGVPAAASDLPVSVLETQLQEFGRCPRQLFSEAHPPRLRSPPWEPQRLREEPVQSEPWYKAVQQLSASALDSAMAPTPSPSSCSDAGGAGARASARAFQGAQEGTAPRGLDGSWAQDATTAAIQACYPQAVPPLAVSGRVTGIASCEANLYSIGEDGCLRVSPFTMWKETRRQEEEDSSSLASVSLRRNFRISPMPLSALAVLRTDLLAIGGHDNAVTVYSSQCGSAVAKCQVHADSVTCLSVGIDGNTIASGSRDQSVRTWAFTGSALKSDATFDDIQQPISCVAAGRSLVLAGATDGQLVAWDRRSGAPAIDRELGGEVVSCALHADEHVAAALDADGEVHLWDLRHRSESLRLSVVPRVGGSLCSARCLLTDFADWALVGGSGAGGLPAVALWGLPEQREVRTWQLGDDQGGGGQDEVEFLIRPQCGNEGGGFGASFPFVCAAPCGAVHAFARRRC